MKVRAQILGSGPDKAGRVWSEDARRALAKMMAGAKVRDRRQSKVPTGGRGLEGDDDPILGEVDSAIVVGEEIIVTLDLCESVGAGTPVGISARGVMEGETITDVEQVDCLGVSDDPEDACWGEVLG